MSGINIVTYFAPILYTKSLGMAEKDALLLGLFTQIWYVLASLVTWYTIDRIGRRKLFISMAVGMSVVLAGLSSSVRAGSTQPMAGVAAVVCVFLFEAFFSWGWMACVWVYPPEILPLKIRAKGAALATAADFLGNFLVVEVTPVGIAKLGWAFYLVWACNLVNAVVVWLVYPETGGLELEAIDRIFVEDIDGMRWDDATNKDTGAARLQWSRVRIAAEAVRESKGRAQGLVLDPEARPLLADASDENHHVAPRALGGTQSLDRPLLD